MSSPAHANGSPRDVRAALTRLIVAACDDALALGAAALVVDDAERRGRLLHQARRRAVFQRDLSVAVASLGGVPVKAGSYRAALSRLARAVRRFLAGPHEGDAYAACARAAEKSSAAYATALRSTLPVDVRFGIERQFSETEWDRHELWRLRFGARPAAAPISGEPESDVASRSLPRLESSDRLAIQTWSDEGGASRAAKAY